MIMGLASLKFCLVKISGRLQAGNSSRSDAAVLTQNFFSGKPQFLLLRIRSKMLTG